jgi:hypothetical protein
MSEFFKVYSVVHKMLVGKPEGRNHLEDLGTDGKIILEWILLT